MDSSEKWTPSLTDERSQWKKMKGKIAVIEKKRRPPRSTIASKQWQQAMKAAIERGPQRLTTARKQWLPAMKEGLPAIDQKEREKMAKEARSAGMEKRWAKMTEEKRSAIGKKISEAWAKKTKKEQAAMTEKEQEIREKGQLSAPVDEDQEYDVSRNEPSKGAFERDDCLPPLFPEENFQEEDSFLSTLLSLEDPTESFSKWGVVLTDSLPNEPSTPLFP
jgi:hypothetical protein